MEGVVMESVVSHKDEDDASAKSRRQKIKNQAYHRLLIIFFFGVVVICLVSFWFTTTSGNIMNPNSDKITNIVDHASDTVLSFENDLSKGVKDLVFGNRIEKDTNDYLNKAIISPIEKPSPNKNDQNNNFLALKLAETERMLVEAQKAIKELKSNKHDDEEEEEEEKEEEEERKNLSNDIVNKHIVFEYTPEMQKRQERIKQAMKHAWKGYREHAWGKDELLPISKGSVDNYGMGLTIIDSLDTLWIMDMKDEFKEAREWVEKNFNPYQMTKTVSVFETTIRVVGGLLSAYCLSKDEIFLKKAAEIADVLLLAYDTPTGIPFSDIDLEKKVASNPDWTNKASILAQAGSVQLELRTLTYYTGNKKYSEAGDRAFFALDSVPGKVHRGIYPFYVRNEVFRFESEASGIGAMADSFYEYMLKLYIQTNQTEPRFKRMYLQSTSAIIKYLTRKSANNLIYIGELATRTDLVKKMDHLACFAGAMFALGAAKLSDLKDADIHMAMGKEITKTCYHGYRMTKTGLAPELWVFKKDVGIALDPENSYYILRPETVESLFYLYRFTGEKEYQEWGWNIFESIEKHTKVTNGYTGVVNVNEDEVEHSDKMESFFLAETLKYLYLLFSPSDLISLDKYVFNTEAHPLPIFSDASRFT